MSGTGGPGMPTGGAEVPAGAAGVPAGGAKVPADGVSACVVCRNEADRLGPCLDSLDWVDEVVVLDLESADGSPELAARHGARVASRSPVPVVEWVRNEVADLARHDWILVVDPDERVSPGLATELRRLAARADVDAVVVPRMNRDLGFAPSHPLHRYEPQLRMYRRSRVRWPEVPNALPEVPAERVHRVPARDELVLVHERSRTIPEVLDRSLRYAPAQARSMIERGERFTARGMISALGHQTYKQLLRARPWNDGVPGLLRAGILVGFHFYVWAAFWQLSGVGRTPEDDRAVRRLGVWLDAARRLLRLLGAPRRLLRRLGRSRAPGDRP